MNTYIYVEKESQKEVFRCYADSLQEADKSATTKKYHLDSLEVSIGIGKIKNTKQVKNSS